MRGKAGAFGCVALLLASLLPMPAGAEAFGSLEVSAQDWQLLTMPYNLTVGRTLFQTPGDVNGDGYDDVLVWRGEFGFVLINGSAAGLDIAHARAVNGGPFGDLADTGSPGSFDQRPTGIDADGDGFADIAGYFLEGEMCGEWPIGSQPPGCLPDAISDLRMARGSATTPLQASATVAEVPGFGGPAPSIHLTGPVGNGASAAFVVETVHPRAADNSTGAWTTFDVYEYLTSGRIQLSWSWNDTEPTPLSDPPRPPRFIAAPDFDHDGYADIVTWSPSGLGSSGGALLNRLTIYRGSANGPSINDPEVFGTQAPSVVIGELDRVAGPDLGFYRVLAFNGTGPTPPYMEIRIIDPLTYNPDFNQTLTIQLSGPSIFLGQPGTRVALGDINGDGVDDIVTAKYDTTSATAGHILVDAFMSSYPPDPCPLCAWVWAPEPEFALSYSTQIQMAGSDIYAPEPGLRVNLQSDYDGDGLRDLTVGFYGGNAPRAPTTHSGFVAVMPAANILRGAYNISIETDAGGIVYPMYRNYTITAQADGMPDATDLDLSFTGFISGPTLRINGTTGIVTSSDESQVVAKGPAYFSKVVCIRAPCPGTLSLPVAFNWSFPEIAFGLSLVNPVAAAPSYLAQSPRVASFHAATSIVGNLTAESDGRPRAPGDWVRGGAAVNFTSSLAVEFTGSQGIQPAEAVTWQLLNAGNSTVFAGDLNASVIAPASTDRGWIAAVDFTGLPPAAGRPSLPFALLVDGDLPTYGDHSPDQSEWVTSLPAFAAVQVFDNESGVDPARIEFSWENDGAPFVRWNQANATPGQTAAEVVATAYLNLPEGNLSNVIWRSWDRAGNGPIESPIYGVKVDTLDIQFRDPDPPADEWQNTTIPQVSVEVLAGASGLNLSSVDFRISTTGLFGFGPWRHDCGFPPELNPPGGPFRMCLAMIGPGGYRPYHYANFTEGDQNWVQWRAANNATGALKLSDPYQVEVDTKPPLIVTLTPDETNVYAPAGVPLFVGATEGSPQSVAQRGINLSSGAATYRVRGPNDADFGAPIAFATSGDPGYFWSATFEAQLTLERGTSTVEVSVRERGGATTTAQTHIRVNQLPTLQVTSLPGNFTIEQNGTIRLTANVTDPEGGRIVYQWGPCQGGPRPPPPNRFYSSADNLTLTSRGNGLPSTATIGNISICLQVFDQYDGRVAIVVTVHIVPQGSLPPPGEQPGPAPPTTVTPGYESALAMLLLLAAAVALAAFFFWRRRVRSPPDNL